MGWQSEATRKDWQGMVNTCILQPHPNAQFLNLSELGNHLDTPGELVYAAIPWFEQCVHVTSQYIWMETKVSKSAFFVE